MKDIKILREKIAKLTAEIKRIENEKTLQAGKITLSIFNTADDLENAEKLTLFKNKIAEVLK